MAGAGFRIEGPAVQRTVNAPLLERPRTQRPAAVRAAIVNGKEFPAQIIKGELAAADLDGAALPGKQARGFGHGKKTGHGSGVFFFQGIAGNWTGGLGAAGGAASRPAPAASPAGPWGGAVRQEAIRACIPWCSAACLLPFLR